jgi:2-methylisocitrate lyase-like PEP mutase family enzyme
VPFFLDLGWPFSDTNMVVSENGQIVVLVADEVAAMNFRARHHSGEPLVLPNAWDAASARVIEKAGAEAIATTSAGVAWSLGVPDGDHLTADDAVAVVARIVRVVDVPVTADIEGGYGDVAGTVKRVQDAGAVGINIEDGVDAQPQRIADARAAGDLFINARIDTFLFGVGGVDETVKRAQEYLDAGADGIFVPGVVDADTIRELVERISAPINVMAGPGAPSVAELAKLGVRRVSVGAAIPVAAYSLVAAAADEILRFGTYDRSRAELTHGDLNSSFAY